MSLTAGLLPLTFTIKSEMKLKAERATPSSSRKISDFGKFGTTVSERLKLDIVVMEARMGGRLDATVMIPDGAVVSTLASFNFNRQGFLGSTVTGLRELGDGGDCEERKPFVLGRQKFPEVGKAHWNIWGYLVRCRAHGTPLGRPS